MTFNTLKSIQHRHVCFVLYDITYLLSLCKQDDLHLRGACVNITCYINLNKIHFLTLSSLSNSFINQCSLISTESQDNSRLGILADLLSTF
ncbi:unnamed protein product [Rotaria sp. Silwood1]|nr:unnamed protein product [Rotaria sp. Silwood1]